MRSDLRPPPDGFVDLRELPSLRFCIGYHRSDNFTGAPLPGYGAPGAWLTAPAAERLLEVCGRLSTESLGLIVYDAYRPRRASAAMVAWCERHGRSDLLDGYVSRDSRHSRGAAVDVGLVHLRSGGALPMGTRWDAFVRGSWFDNAVGAARAHRRVLRQAMVESGFRPYWKEWWHFELPLDPAPAARDVPYGESERPEAPAPRGG